MSDAETPDTLDPQKLRGVAEVLDAVTDATKAEGDLRDAKHCERTPLQSLLHRMQVNSELLQMVADDVEEDP